MELLYNPNRMPEEEVKATFVARQHLVDELVSLIERQPDGAGVQHVVIIAPRGMGKTTVLLMVQFAVRDRGLSTQWQTVKFPEESYGIYDLADLWIEVIDHLATETSDEKLREKIASIKSEYPDGDDLQEAALAVIKDWRKKHGRRLLLLVDNFDMILEQINDERDNARLREVLMNDGTMMLIGGATTFFHEARAYDQPLYNFFKIYDLERLKFEEMQELLRRRAEADGRTNFEEKLQANTARLRALEYFTGGNPRLVIMLYRVVTLSDLADARRGLEKLLDEATPFYKHKTESLPAQQRKILDYIARESSRTFEGVTPTQVAEATRMTPNQASAQLKRLAELGYVQAANLRGRSTFYVLSERLYAIWYKMRFGRDARQRMEWLVDFMKSYYDAEEMISESRRLDGLFREHLSAGRLREAGSALEYRHCFALAMGEEILTPDLLASLPPETLDYLQKAGWISEETVNRSRASAHSFAEEQHQSEFTNVIKLALAALSEERTEDALQKIDLALKLDPKSDMAWLIHGGALRRLSRYEEAIASYDNALEINPGFYEIWTNRGSVLGHLGRYEEALVSFDRALSIKPNDHKALYNRGLALGRLGEYQEALSCFDKSLQIKKDNYEAWSSQGYALHLLGKYEEAILNYDNALAIEPNYYQAWYNRANTLCEMERYEEAIDNFDRALKLKPDSNEAWNNRGNTLVKLGRMEEAIKSFDQALRINPKHLTALYNRATALLEVSRVEEAIASYDQILEIRPSDFETWSNRGSALLILSKFEEAISSFDRTLEIKPDDHIAWFNRGTSLLSLGRYEEAIESYDRALDTNQNDSEAWHNRGTALGNLGKHKEALSSFNRALEINPDLNEAWSNRALVCLNLFISSLNQGREELAKQNWDLARSSSQKIGEKDWHRFASSSLWQAIQAGHLELAQQLIRESDLEEPLFPLARAIDYLLTNDEALIEKLSPEVRGIVEEIVAKLGKSSGKTPRAQATAQKKKTGKKKSGPRSRVRKQLV